MHGGVHGDTVQIQLAEAAKAISIMAVVAVCSFANEPVRIDVISKPFTNVVRSFGDTFGIELSANGNWAALTISGNPSSQVANSELQVFLRNTRNGQSTLISRSTNSAPGNGSSIAIAISADGRYVTFESDASDLVPDDTNEDSDTFVYDHSTGNLSVIQSAEAEASSADGRYMVFLTTDTNLVTLLEDRPSHPQLVLRDSISNTNIWVSRDQNGLPLEGVRSPVLSADGSLLVFHSEPATRLGTNETTGEIFTNRYPKFTWTWIYSARSNLLERVPVPADLVTFSDDSGFEFALSANGRFLAHTIGRSSRQPYLYLYDTLAKTNSLVIPAPQDPRSVWTLTAPQLSEDGQIVTFVTDVISPGPAQLYAYNQVSGQITLLSRTATGAAADDEIHSPALSADGSTAGFITLASNFTGEDDRRQDVFVVSTSGSGAPTLLFTPDTNRVFWTANGGSRLMEAYNGDTAGGTMHGMSIDGKRLLFKSSASDLVPGDTNGVMDLFVHGLESGTTRAPLLLPPNERMAAYAAMSADGRRIVFSDRIYSPRHLYVYDAITDVTTGPIWPDNAEPEAVVSGLVYGITVDGRTMAFTAYGRLSRETTGYIYDFQQQTFSRFPLSNLSYRFSRMLNYLMSYQGSSLFDWRSQTVQRIPGELVSWSHDDEVALLGSPGFRYQKEFANLYLYYPGSGPSNLIATNVSFPVISGDGSTVVFGQDNKVRIYSVFAQVTTSVPGDHRLFGAASLSPDGRYVAFASRATNEPHSVYAFDRVLTNLTLINRTATGERSILGATSPNISADGTIVVFDSGSPDLVPNDYNEASDVFVARLTPRDSDADGLEDGWELQHFGSLGPSAQSDADSDGATDLEEFRRGTDPVDPLSAAPILVINDAELVWPATPWRSYQLQYRQRIGSGEWQNYGAPIMAFSNVVRVPLSHPVANGFYRFELL